jgi:NAD(P)-dependent dehydrogenase (short-subunit alcohol dehydrogenase family)
MKERPFIDFEGKKILVSGASSGIGRAIAIELSQRGADAVLLGRDADRLAETASVTGTPDEQILRLDLGEPEAVLPAIRDLSRRIGRIYGLCHSAGIVETRPLGSYKIDGLQAMLNVHLISGMELARAIGRRDILEKEGGSILFISSIYGLVGKPGQIGYSASKGAIAAAARGMAIELARRNIRVNTLSPGLVRTRLATEALSLISEENVKALEGDHPLGIGTPEDVARAAAFLLSPQSAWITGTNMVIDGGYTAL